jgi:hypothetical protein
MEQACLDMYNNMARIKSGKKRLGFRLGAGREAF